MQPSSPDVWATAETVDLLKEAGVFKENLKSAITMNRKTVKIGIGRAVREALLTLNTLVLEAGISQRVAFAEEFTLRIRWLPESTISGGRGCPHWTLA